MTRMRIAASQDVPLPGIRDPGDPITNSTGAPSRPLSPQDLAQAAGGAAPGQRVKVFLCPSGPRLSQETHR